MMSLPNHWAVPPLDSERFALSAGFYLSDDMVAILPRMT